MTNPCDSCNMEENCYSVWSCDRYLKWRFPERYEKKDKKEESFLERQHRELLAKGMSQCPECNFVEQWKGQPNPHYHDCQIHQKELQERGTLLPHIPKKETKKESITDKMSKKWYDI